ncbi:MAG: hypothetical protein J0H89_10810 [Rhizobiales bacterium]|nr:hypothetical protein [Hyphomicrobiales bacterium]
MSFENVAFIAKPLKDVQASISYRKNATKLGRSKNPVLIIGIPKTAMGEFKAKKEQTFIIAVGAGVDAGKARILPDTSDGVLAKHLKGGLVFRFGYVPMLGEDSAEKEFVPVKALGKDGFEITLPAWFKRG